MALALIDVYIIRERGYILVAFIIYVISSRGRYVRLFIINVARAFEKYSRDDFEENDGSSWGGAMIL